MTNKPRLFLKEIIHVFFFFLLSSFLPPFSLFFFPSLTPLPSHPLLPPPPPSLLSLFPLLSSFFSLSPLSLPFLLPFSPLSLPQNRVFCLTFRDFLHKNLCAENLSCYFQIQMLKLTTNQKKLKEVRRYYIYIYIICTYCYFQIQMLKLTTNQKKLKEVYIYICIYIYIVYIYCYFQIQMLKLTTNQKKLKEVRRRYNIYIYI